MEIMPKKKHPITWRIQDIKNVTDEDDVGCFKEYAFLCIYFRI